MFKQSKLVSALAVAPPYPLPCEPPVWFLEYFQSATLMVLKWY